MSKQINYRKYISAIMSDTSDKYKVYDIDHIAYTGIDLGIWETTEQIDGKVRKKSIE